MASTIHPRVLVVSHRAFNDKGCTGITLSSFFKDWDPDGLAELYFHAEAPHGPMCHRYYRITDFEALGSALRRQPCGRIIGGVGLAGTTGEVDPVPSPLQLRVYEFGWKQYASVMLLRDAIWRAAVWRTRDLDAWVDDFSPDVVFLVGGEYTFTYDVACHLARRRTVPLVVFLGDDVYSICRHSLSPLFWLQKALLRRTLRGVLGSAARLFSTCDLMGEEYQRIFGAQYTTLPTPCGQIAPGPAPGAHDPVELSYLGKVSIGRWTTLRRIGEALSQINVPRQRAVLRIYTRERLDGPMLARLSIPGAMEFAGCLNAAEVEQVIERSDILVHVESMDEVSRKLTRLSLSTKIPQYLASGKCLLAVGPAEVASIRYVQDHAAGMVVTDLETLRGNLETLISGPELRRRYTVNSLRLARQRHDSKIVTDLLATTLRGVMVAKSEAGAVLAAAHR
jgi:hypothetical protein